MNIFASFPRRSVNKTTLSQFLNSAANKLHRAAALSKILVTSVACVYLIKLYAISPRGLTCNNAAFGGIREPNSVAFTLILYYNMRCFFVCLVSMESHTVQLTHMTFILSELGWAWAGFSHSPIIRFDG